MPVGYAKAPESVLGLTKYCQPWCALKLNQFSKLHATISNVADDHVYITLIMSTNHTRATLILMRPGCARALLIAF